MSSNHRIILNLVIIFSILFGSIGIHTARAEAVFYSITGKVSAPDGSGVEGVNIHVHTNVYNTFIPYSQNSASGSAGIGIGSQPVAVGDYIVTTDSNGNFFLGDLLNWQLTIYAEKGGIIFEPLQQVVYPAVTKTVNFHVSTPSPVIPPTTAALSSQTNLYIESISPDGSVYTYSQTTPELQQIKIGDFLVAGISSAAQNGFLRRVTAISPNGLVFTTEPASLEDVIEDGAAYNTQMLLPADVRSGDYLPGVVLDRSPAVDPVTFSFAVNNVVLYDEDGNRSTTSDQIIANGTLDFELNYEFYLNIESFKLKKLTFASNNTLRNKLTVESKLASAKVNKEEILASQTFSPITVMVGVVPVVFVPQLDVVVGMDGSVKIGISSSIEQSITSRAGVSYTDGAGWRPISEDVSNFNFSPPQLTAEASLKGYFGIRLNQYLYGVAGPYIKVTAFSELKIAPLEQPWWSLYGGIEIPAGFRATEALNKIFKISEYEVVAVSVKRKLADSGIINHPPKTPSNPSPASGASGVSPNLTLSWTGEDPDGDLLNYDIYLGKTNPPTTLVSASQISTTYKTGPLTSASQYYWRVVAWDEHGAKTTGPVWKFMTSDYSGSAYRDSTTSNLPSASPGCYIYSGFNLPYANPRFIQILWPVPLSINSLTQGTTTFSFWARNQGTATTQIRVNGKSAGTVVAKITYDWVTLDFPTSMLNNGGINTVEIWPANPAGAIEVGCNNNNPSDNFGAPNEVYIRNNGGTSSDVGPLFGNVWAKLTVRTK